MSRRAWLFGLAALWPLNVAAGEDPARRFRERVAPVLEKRCVSCHSGGTAKGKLDLTSAESVRKGGDSGPAVVPGKPDESALLDAVTGSPPEMPKQGEPLTPAQVADIRDWVSSGAVWPDGLVLRDRRFEGESWWAFAPLKRPPVPAVHDNSWARNEVDRFVMARLEAESLAPSPEADRRTLIRRLTFDLHGLPPTPAEVEAFVADPAPDAYERLADRLLASPRYGERWGRHWLDVVHYGDTHGYDKDKRRDHAWPYRDYVIKALNADVPYSRFVREQIAGDVLAPNDPSAVAASGFVAAGPWDFVGHVELREGTVDKAKTRALDRDDMVSNVVSTFQSLTAHCARCHDHKFDPIPQTDYYRLQAVFAGIDRGDRPLPETPDSRRAVASRERVVLATRLKDLENQIARLSPPELVVLDTQIAARRAELDGMSRPASTTPSPTNGYHSAIHPTAESLAWVQVDLGKALPIDEVRLVPARPVDFADTPGFGFAPRMSVQIGNDPAFTPGSARFTAEIVRPDARPGIDEPYIVRPGRVEARYVLVAASSLWKRLDDYILALSELEVISDGVNVALGRPVTSLDSIEGGLWRRSALVDGHDSRRPRPPASDPIEAHRSDILFALQALEQTRREKAEALVPSGLRVEREDLTRRLRTLDDQIKGLASEGHFYGLITHSPRPVNVLNRGEVEQPGALVGPGALSCIPGLEPVFSLPRSEDEGSRRAALAEWVASPRNMLTWRSIANRVWHYHFGRGIVDSPNDFGRNGSKPTHPELLDWLAAELRDSGESLKSLHRLIVTSATYRQSSRGDAVKERQDADNRWLWRQNRRRLEAESVRDSVLAVTGTLDGRMFGPGFDLFRFKDDHSPIYDHTAPGASDNPAVRRRTVYRFTVRSVPNPFLECMDSADPNLNTPARSTTITALQALALLNDEFILSQSREFARRLEWEGSGLDRAYLLALGRPPKADERQALDAHAARFGLAKACRVLLNTNEFLFVD